MKYAYIILLYTLFQSMLINAMHEKNSYLEKTIPPSKATLFITMLYSSIHYGMKAQRQRISWDTYYLWLVKKIVCKTIHTYIQSCTSPWVIHKALKTLPYTLAPTLLQLRKQLLPSNIPIKYPKKLDDVSDLNIILNIHAQISKNNHNDHLARTYVINLLQKEKQKGYITDFSEEEIEDYREAIREDTQFMNFLNAKANKKLHSQPNKTRLLEYKV